MRAEALNFGPLTGSVVASVNNNTPCQATVAAAPGVRHCCSGFTISCGAAPAATVSATLKDGATVIEQLELPAAAFAPIVVEYKRMRLGTPGQALTLEIPAVGGTTRATAVLRYISQQA